MMESPAIVVISYYTIFHQEELLTTLIRAVLHVKVNWKNLSIKLQTGLTGF